MRKTIADLTDGVYDFTGHANLADRGARRYRPFSFDFDSTPQSLELPDENWDEQVKRLHLISRARAIKRLELKYGTHNIDQTIKNTIDLGSKSMSLLSYHNELNEQARRSFVISAYYPALVAACALGERILNHLILDLRSNFMASPHYRKVYRKNSFEDWKFAVTVLADWQVLANDVGDDFLALGKLRNFSIHFNPASYQSMRDNALAALKCLDKIIAKQFGYFGGQPWFIEGTPGAQFIKRAYETDPFVKNYIIPHSGLVGPLHAMEMSQDGGWDHLDHDDYGDEDLTDEEFALRFRERDPEKVYTAR